jgi:hypothetical protein
MTISVSKVGRDLHIHMEGVKEPFIIHPLPARAGIQVTDAYLNSTVNPQALIEALQIAVDGGVKGDDGVWVPLPEEQQTNYNRIGDELSQEEGNDVIMPAFFWQTVLGMDGVNEYIKAGEGLAGTLKATGALSARLGRLVQPTSPAESKTA